MMTITLIPGDGIGPSVAAAAVRVVSATTAKVNWETVVAGVSALDVCGTPLPPKTIESIRRNKVALKGPTGTPIGEGFSSINVELRKMFELHLNLRPIRSMKGVKSIHPDVDLIVCRENTEELYTGEERYTDETQNEAIVIGRITRKSSERFFKSVFEYAESRGRKKVSVFHKANILKLTNGLFLKVAREFAAKFPNIIYEERIVDAGSMQVVMNPTRFDVIATTNLFGDIDSDAFAGLVGGLGVAPGANIGNEYSIFEAIHGTAPDIAGKNLANPTALILSAAMMLEHLQETKAARWIRKAVADVLAEGKNVTRDLNSDGVGTVEMTNAIVGKIEDQYDLEAECYCS